jgi:dihydroorotate dehydrogenase (fumarate)
MANLSTNYLGVPLKNPIVLGASNFISDINQIKKAEQAGVAAIVYKTLFEEQIQLESLQFDEELHEYDLRSTEMQNIFPGIEYAGPTEHLMKLRKLKESVSIPVIASVNALYNSTWVDYAKLLEQTGVDGLEVNFYRVPVTADDGAEEIESNQVKILKDIRETIKIPINVKISPFYTNPIHFVKRLAKAGADGFVLFNRFFQPEIDFEKEKFYFPWELTQPGDYKLTLRFMGLLFGNVNGTLIANRGIKTSEDVIRMILAGADAVQIVSAFYENSFALAKKMILEIEEWMDKKGYATLDDFKGNLSKKNMKDEFVYGRAQYVDIFKNADEILKIYPMR